MEKNKEKTCQKWKGTSGRFRYKDSREEQVDLTAARLGVVLAWEEVGRGQLGSAGTSQAQSKKGLEGKHDVWNEVFDVTMFMLVFPFGRRL